MCQTTWVTLYLLQLPPEEMVQFDWSKEEFVPLVHAKNEGDINSGEAQPEGKILGQLFLYLNVLSHFIEKNKKTEGVLQYQYQIRYVRSSTFDRMGALTVLCRRSQ